MLQSLFKQNRSHQFSIFSQSLLQFLNSQLGFLISSLNFNSSFTSSIEMTTAADEDELQQSSSILSSFLEITGTDAVETARRFLDVTNWNLDEAIQLFFIRGSENQWSDTSPSDHDSSSNNNSPPLMEENHQSDSNWFLGDEGVRAPLPVRREALYGHEEEMALALAASRAESDSLGWMYPPPTNLMFNGTFEKAKEVASMEEKWLLVNLQSKKEFHSHMLNRDTWSNEGLAQILEKNLIFWQVSDDTIEGAKISTYYKLHDSVLPVVLLLDPITGQKVCSWNGMIEADVLMEKLDPFMDAGIKGKFPHLHHHHRHQQQQQPRESTDLQRNIVNQEQEDKELMMLSKAFSMGKTLSNGDPVCPSTSTDTEMDEESSEEEGEEGEEEEEEEEEEDSCLMEEEKKRTDTYPALPEEPKTVDRKLVCRVGFRLPQDGRRVQRCFLRTDPIQLLWSFIISQLDEADVGRPFLLTVPQGIIGAATKALDYESKLSFGESGLSNSMVSVTWDD